MIGDTWRSLGFVGETVAGQGRGPVDCSACGVANRDGAKFCSECGHSFVAACEACGTELRATAKFCDECGTAVAGAGRRTIDDHAARKTVTVVFCDLVGSTAFGEQVDAESTRDALAEYHQMARSVIEGHAGVVAKFIGDGVMALFGVPVTAEDDARRAVLAGIALQAAFEPLARRVTRRHGVELGLRVGINTGEVVIAEADDDVVGDALNTAARLEAACEPGRVLVGEDTWRLTRAGIAYEVLGEVQVKGKDAPVATFEVVSAADEVDDLNTPFVGRVDELTRLAAVFDDAVEHRGARVATVIGSPGVGKTRLSRELRQRVADRADMVEIRCRQSGTATFAPIADLLRTATGITDDDAPVEVMNELRALVADLDDADRVAQLLASFVGAAPARSTEEAFFAVRRLIEAVARDRGLVLIVDDIQWAEPLFLDLIEHLADWVRDAPTLILALARPEIREIRPSLSTVGRAVSAAIALEGLDAAATAEFAAKLVGAESLPADLVERLPLSTEGNPLFVRELMRMLVDDGVIVRTESGWSLTIEADAVEVPPTIQSLLSARLDRMAPDERRVIELASVVGSEFPLGAVMAIATDSVTDSMELRRILNQLRERELVEPAGTFFGDDSVYRFHHVLIRDAAYRRLLKRVRAELHVLVGEWFERAAATVPGEHEARTAYHFERAHHYRIELSETDHITEQLGRRAAALLRTAARSSLVSDDIAAAGALAERALDCLPGDAADALAIDLLLLGCEATLTFGDAGRGAPMVDRFRAVAGDDQQRAWAACFDAHLAVLTSPSRLPDLLVTLDDAAHHLAAAGDEPGVAKARLVRASALARLGRIGESEAELDLALTAARSADDRRRVATVLGVAPVAALWGPSPIPRAGGRCLDVVRLLRIATGSPAVEAVSVRCQAVLEALRGRFETARSMLAEARATVEELGLRHGVLEVDFYWGIVELLAGESTVAEDLLRQAYDGFVAMGIDADAGHAAAYLSRALLRLGRIDEADEVASISVTLAGQNPQTGIAARTVQAEVLAARGDVDGAFELAREAVTIAATTDLVIDHADAAAALAEIAIRAGHEREAERAVRSAEELYESKAAVVGVRRHRTSRPVGSTHVTADRDAPATGQGPHDPIGPNGRSVAPQIHLDTTVVRLVARIGDAMRDGTFAQRVDEFCDPDFVRDDRRQLGSGALDIADFSRHWATADESLHDSVVLAVRGDDLVLSSGIRRWANGAESAFLIVQEMVSTSRIGWVAMLDDDDLDAAYRLLDERWMTRLSPADRADAEFVVRYVVASSGENVDEYGDMHHPDFRLDDHRRIGFGSIGRDQYVEVTRAKVATMGGERFRLIRRDIVGPGVHLHLQQVDGMNADGVTWERLRYVVLHVVDGRMKRLVVFEEHEREAALAQARRLGDQHEQTRSVGQRLARPADDDAFGTLAADAGLEFAKRFNSEGDLGELFADGFLRDDRRRGANAGVGGVDAVVMSLQIWREQGARFEAMTAIAVRDQNFALFRVRTVFGAGVGEVSMLQAGRVSEDGRFERWFQFDGDDHDAALDELNKMWFASLSEAERSTALVLAEWAAAAATWDVERFDRLVSDDFEGYDAAEFGPGRIDRATFLASQRARGELEGPATSHLVDLIEVVRPDAMVTRVINRGADPEWGADYERRRTTVHQVIDGRVCRFGVFDYDDVHGARAWARELSGGDRVAREARTSGVDAANSAVTGLEFVMDLLARDLGFDAEFDEGFVRDDRRRGVNAGAGRKSDVVESLRNWRSQGATYPERPAPVALRGDRHALTVNRADFDGERSETVVLQVTTVSEGGLQASWTLFDEGDLDDAMIELDRLWFESLTPDEQATVSVLRQWSSAAATWDVERFDRDLLHENVWGFDGSQLGQGWHDRAEILDNQSARRDLEGDDVSRVIDLMEFVRPDVAVSRIVATGSGQAWGVDWERRRTLVRQVVDGKVYRLGLFDYDDLDAARAWARSLVSEDAPGRHLNNIAILATERAGALVRDGAEFADCFDDGFVRYDRRRDVNDGTGSKADVVEGLLIWRDQGGVPQPVQPIAVRGDRHALFGGSVEFDAGRSVVSMLQVVEVTGAGTQLSWTLFDDDDLNAALRELDRLWFESLGPEEQDVARVLRGWTQAALRWDVERFDRDLVAADFAAFEGGRLGGGWQDRTTFLASQAAIGDLEGGDWSGIVDLVEFVGPGTAVVRFSSRGETPEWGAAWERRQVVAFQIDDGKVRRFGIFDDEQLDEARAWARSPEPADDHGSALGRLDNAIVRSTDEILTAWSRHDLVPEWFADDFVREDRRPLVAMPTVGKEDWSEIQRELFELGAGEFTHTPLAIRDERFLLNRSQVAFGDGARRIDYVMTGLAAPDGRHRRWYYHEPEQLREAAALLDELWLPTVDDELAAAVTLVNYWHNAYAGIDEDRIAQVVAPDVVAADHRQLGFGELDFEGGLELMRSRAETRGPGWSFVVQVHSYGRGVIAWMFEEHTNDDAGGTFANRMNVVSTIRDDRISRLDLFDEHDVAGTVAWAAALRD